MSPEPFTRDRLTLLAYAMAGIFGYTIAALGPAMPLLRDDLGISRTVGGLHFTVAALGAVATGFVLDRLAQRFGRRRLFWASGAMVAGGALLIGAGRHPAVTLLGATLVGAAGAGVLSSSQSTLADLHRSNRTVALTEGNTATSLGSVLPALVIGGLVTVGIGWRLAFAVPAALYVATALGRATEPFPAATATVGRQGRRLPSAYWYYWAALVPAVGAEWSVAAWGAGYLVEIAGTSEAVASLLMTLFFGAMVLGRLIASRLARHFEPLRILAGSAAVGLGGFMLFWLPDARGLIVSGLFATGLGISTLFPMLLSMAVGAAADRSDAATARISISAGSAVVLAPLALGWLADRSGIRDAFAVVPVLLALVVAIALSARSVHGRGASP